MRINGFRCDGCKKEHLLEPTRILQYHGEGIPLEWLVLWLNGHKLGNEEPHVFCSKVCLYEWLTNQLKYSDERSPHD